MFRIPTTLTAVSLVALTGLAGCQTADKAALDTKSAVQAQTTPALSTTDTTFLNTASQLGLEEVKLGELAATKAHSPRVRAFAQQTQVHQATQDRLAAIAQKNGITPTSVMDTAHDQRLSQLQGESGRAFDRDYVAGEVADHQAVVAAEQNEIAQGTDPDVKNLAQTLLADDQKHLTEAQHLLSSGATGHHHRMHHKQAS